MKIMPLLTSNDRDEYFLLKGIPWDLIAPFEAQAQSNHGQQTLERLKARGGLSASEALAIIEGRGWHEIGNDRLGDELKLIKLMAPYTK